MGQWPTSLSSGVLVPREAGREKVAEKREAESARDCVAAIREFKNNGASPLVGSGA